MVEPPVLALKDVAVSFGRAPLFEHLDAGIGRGERISLVGRNGSGKSTLLKTLAGLIEPDAGARFVQPGLRIAYLPQEASYDREVTVEAHVAAGLGARVSDVRRHRIDAILSRLALDGSRPLSELSGGEARRASLARALVGEPDVLLLDEPTNHLDLPTIEWLERFLAAFPGGVLAISHDRAFLARLSTRTWWLDRGRLRVLERGFAHFEAWSEEILEEEARAQAKLERRIESESEWLGRSITARRKRNEGRKRRLLELRAQRAAWLGPQGRARLAAATEESRARLFIDAESIAKSWPAPDPDAPPRVILKPFSTRIMRGDRIGVIGPNGAGKTTLIRLLTGDLAPDTGKLRLAKTIRPAYFDQRRAVLDPAKTLREMLCPKGGDHVNVRGRPRHVVAYLRDFLFDDKQSKGLVGALSGGERNRLLLAITLARPSNLLALDEPTNDLDMDTLDLLQETLDEYEGTLLIVSHDRDFLDRLANGILAMKGDGTVEEYAGGYSDYLVQSGAASGPSVESAPLQKSPARADRATGLRAPRPRLSYREMRELDALPAEIERLSTLRTALERGLADPSLYARDRGRFEAAMGELATTREALERAEARWLELAQREEELAAGRK